MFFHWSLSDSMSPQVSMTLLRILAVLNNIVVWMVSTRPPISKSSSPFSHPLVTVPKAPITIGVIVTCLFHSFFNSLARSRYLSFFSHSFSFILSSTGTAKSTILQVPFFLLIIIRSGLFAEMMCVYVKVPYYLYHYLLFEIFSHHCKPMVFHWSLSDSKSPQVSRTLLSILAVLNNIVVWMVSILPFISMSSSPFNNPLVTVPKVPITIGIIVTLLSLLLLYQI